MRKQKLVNNQNLVVKDIEELSSILGADSVIGKPIVAQDKTIIPVSRVTIGRINGGGEYGEVKIFEKNHPYAGGVGSIVNMSPQGFLIIEKSGANFIKVNDTFVDTVFDKTTEILGKTINGKN